MWSNYLFINLSFNFIISFLTFFLNLSYFLMLLVLVFVSFFIFNCLLHFLSLLFSVIVSLFLFSVYLVYPLDINFYLNSLPYFCFFVLFKPRFYFFRSYFLRSFSSYSPFCYFLVLYFSAYFFFVPNPTDVSRNMSLILLMTLLFFSFFLISLSSLLCSPFFSRFVCFIFLLF